jgi:hypothetical protein
MLFQTFCKGIELSKDRADTLLIQRHNINRKTARENADDDILGGLLDTSTV